MLEIIYESEVSKAMYDAAKKQVRTEYAGLVHVNPSPELLLRVMEFAAKKEVRTMIANLTQMRGTFTQTLDFFEKVFYPTMIKNGLHSYACALSPDAFTRYAIEQLQKKVGGKLDWRAFQTLEEAEKWMDSQIELHGG